MKSIRKTISKPFAWLDEHVETIWKYASAGLGLMTLLSLIGLIFGAFIHPIIIIAVALWEFAFALWVLTFIITISVLAIGAVITDD